MGDDDDWPAIRQKMLASDVLLLSTPIWLGHPASYTQRVLERLDAELSEQDDKGRMLTYGKCAAVAVVGNEDGAHHVCAEVFQGLNDVGFSLAAGAAVYWNGEAMHTTDYKDLESTPDKVVTTQKTLVTNTLHLAKLLKADSYPPTQ
jgi:multimeric flavodoxin WrbA